MSRFPQDMLLWPEGAPRVLNVDNRLEGQINGVPYRVEIRGDFANCSFVNMLGQQLRMYQPHFNALGVVIGCIEVSEGREFGAPMMGLRPAPRPPEGDGD